MNRDELERCAKYLEQGLELDRHTQQRLVQTALQLAGGRRQHVDGCGWHRGEACDSNCPAAPPKNGAHP